MTHEEMAYHQGRDSIIDALCKWMLETGLTTGHGDNVGAVLSELGQQIEQIRRQRDAARQCLQSYVDVCTNDECEWCEKARVALSTK